MTRERLQELLSGAKNARITVLGDFCLDKYLYIDASLDEPSLETGLTAFQVTGRKLSPGGAGNVCANLAALGAKVLALGVIGNDGEGYDLLRALRARGIEDALVRTEKRCTSTYVKPMRSGADGYTEQNRLDLKNFAPLAPEDEAALLRSLEDAAEQSDAILVVDQFLEEDCGTVNSRVKDALAGIAAEKPELVIFADSRAAESAGSNMAARIAIIAITTSNSIRVKLDLRPALKHLFSSRIAKLLIIYFSQ